MCAGIRAARSMNRYLKRIEELMRLNPRLKPVLITLTVKNGESLDERYNHLTSSFRTLFKPLSGLPQERPGFNQFCKIDGGFYTTEYTYNKTTGQWHPHIHIFALLTDWIDQEELAETWHEITYDSYIVDVRRVRKPKLRDTAKLLQRFVSMLSSLVIYRLKHMARLFNSQGQTPYWFFWFYAWRQNP